MTVQKQAVCYKEYQVRVQGQDQARQYMSTLPRHLRTAASSLLRAHNERSIHQARLAHTIQYEMFRAYEAQKESCIFTVRVQRPTKDLSTTWS
jgi:hypothetical protein